MARIVVKNGFLKGGSTKIAAHLDYLVKYIATREGVEKINNGRELAADWRCGGSRRMSNSAAHGSATIEPTNWASA